MQPTIGRLSQSSGLFKSALNCQQNGAIASVINLNHFLSLVQPYSTRLAEVGKLESKQPHQNYYPSGQTFLHAVFGYRGVTLFPWLAKIHDRKQQSESSLSASRQESHNASHQKSQNHQKMESADSSAHESNPESLSIPTNINKQPNQFHPYYQVLIDIRDCNYVSSRTQTEAVTFLGHPDNSKSVHSIKGLDYVAHEDIIPYTSHEKHPIQHELHSKLFKLELDTDSNSKVFVPTEVLESWRSKHPWLELSRVYRETTENVRITVIPFYLGHTIIDGTSFHWWRYCVRLENFGDYSIQLRERHWKIFSPTKMLQTIKGRGVVGVEPLLTKQEPAYQYSSHVNLEDRSGHMWGTFKMEREDGLIFECRIPPFSLESSIENLTPPNSKRSNPRSDET